MLCWPCRKALILTTTRLGNSKTRIPVTIEEITEAEIDGHRIDGSGYYQLDWARARAKKQKNEPQS